MDYITLEKIRETNRRRVCIFGAGKIGRTWAYEILTCAGFKVECYCDNKLLPGTEIRDGIRTISFDNLCNAKEQYLVFLAVNEKLQDEIKQQFDKNEITEYYEMGFLFLQELCESIVDSLEEGLLQKYKPVVDDASFLKIIFKDEMGRTLDLENPKTYNEKLQWLKLYNRNPEYTKLVDKYELKKHVMKSIGKEYVIPTLGIWNSVEEIEWDKLPDQFVLKCTHDSGSVIICKDKSTFDMESACKRLKRALKRNFYWVGREWPYKNVNPRIMAEQYMEDNGELRDYKFYTFKGNVALLYVATDRMAVTEETKFDFFDRNYNHLNVLNGHPNAEIPPLKPQKYEEMIFVAEKIAQEIPHVRVDFYEVAGHIYVGEMTFYPLSGLVKFEPEEWDYKLGDLLNLERDVVIVSKETRM